MRICLGRYVYGLAAIAFGVIALVWGDFNTWQQIRPLGNIGHRETLLFLAAAVEILGGLAIQWSRTARAGAVALGVAYLIFALLWIPAIVAKPGVYDGWGNFFEQFSLVSAALVAYGSADRRNTQPTRWLEHFSCTFIPERLRHMRLFTKKSRTSRRLVGHSNGRNALTRTGCLLFGVCVISFTLEQVLNLSATAAFVPKWIPLGQMFWAVATTAAFALAAVAILSGRAARIASGLLTVMILGFGLLVWLPILFADPHKLFNWAGNAQNLAIAGAAWVVTDFFQAHRRHAASALETGSLVAS